MAIPSEPSVRESSSCRGRNFNGLHQVSSRKCREVEYVKEGNEGARSLKKSFSAEEVEILISSTNIKKKITKRGPANQEPGEVGSGKLHRGAMPLRGSKIGKV